MRKVNHRLVLRNVTKSNLRSTRLKQRGGKTISSEVCFGSNLQEIRMISEMETGQKVLNPNPYRYTE